MNSEFNLPPELWEEVFRHSSPETLFRNVRAVNLKFQALVVAYLQRARRPVHLSFFELGQICDNKKIPVFERLRIPYALHIVPSLLIPKHSLYERYGRYCTLPWEYLVEFRATKSAWAALVAVGIKFSSPQLVIEFTDEVFFDFNHVLF